MTSPSLPILCSALLAATGACSTLELGVEADAVCTTVPTIEFAGSPYPATTIAMSQSVSIEEQLDDLADAIADLSEDFGFDASAHLASGTVMVSSAHLDSLDFVNTFEVVALTRDEATALASLEAAGSIDGLTAELDVEPVDLLALIAADTRELDVTVRGRPPSEPWQLGLDLCFSAEASY